MSKLLATDGEGERLDRYELIGELASGGMATVFLARLSGVGGFQRLVAIKRLHPHLANEHEFVEMFLDEARLAARIHHPNVVPILEVGAERARLLPRDGVRRGRHARAPRSRARRRRRRPVPPARRVRIVLDTLAGLHAAHELNDDHGAAARARPSRRVAAEHPRRRRRHRAHHRLRRRARGLAARRRRAPGSSRASSRTWRRSRRAATTSTAAPTCSRAASCSGRCSRRSASSRATARPRRSNRVLYEPIPPPSSVAPRRPARRSRTSA